MKIRNVEAGRIFLGPMAGVTDIPFRILCKEQGADLIYTEMVSAKGIHYNNSNTKDMLKVDERERPVAIQLFGSEPDIMAETAKRIEELNFDIFDINMGCPVPKVVNNGEGSALMKNPVLAGQIVSAVVNAVKKPVTVKFRKGFSSEDRNAPEFARIMEECGADAVAVHGRTREQYYSGKADWDIIAEVKQNVKIPVIGNGDIFSPSDALRMFEYTGCDAIMIARGAQGNPWIFGEIKKYLGDDPEKCSGKSIRNLQEEGIFNGKPGFTEVYSMIEKHLEMLIELKGEWTAIREMRKHIAWYTEGFPYSAGLRRDINLCLTREEIMTRLREYGERLER